MELRADHEGMVADLTDLHEAAIRRSAAGDEAELAELLPVDVVKLVAMAMPLPNVFHPISGVSLRTGDKAAGVGAQTHRPALAFDALLLRQEADHGMRRVRVELCRIHVVSAEGCPESL